MCGINVYHLVFIYVSQLSCRYAKFSDKDNWISIDEKTAEIRLNKAPDRESLFLINGTYYAKILCITNGESS